MHRCGAIYQCNFNVLYRSWLRGPVPIYNKWQQQLLMKFHWIVIWKLINLNICILKNVGDFYISFCQDLNDNADEYNIIITEGFVSKYIESIGGENNPVFTARCYASAVLAMGLCPPVSVCLSVTSRSSTKTEKRRITQTTPHDTSGTLVFWRQRSPRNSTGVTPYGGADCRWDG